MNLSQLVLTLLLAAVATTSIVNAAKEQVQDVKLLKRNKRQQRKLRNHQQKMRKLTRAMSINPIPPDTSSPVSNIKTGEPTPSPVSNIKTLEPTPSPMEDPTNEPTESPTTNDCDDIGNAKESRDGVQYDLRFFDDKSCRDGSGQRYQYGEIDNVDNFDDCAETCVQDVPSALLSSFRGIDFVCESKNRDSCRCLYDAGALDDNARSLASDGVFDSTNTDGTGKGSVGGNGFVGRFRRVGLLEAEDAEFVCVKLESSRLVDVDVAVA